VSLRPTGDPNALRYLFRGGGVTSSGILRRSVRFLHEMRNVETGDVTAT
jgi:hypothetical protein